MLRAAACCLLLLPLLTSGCALCTNCEDDTYSAYGGRWERDIANSGRVGSAFEPAGHLIDGGGFVVDQPTPADALLKHPNATDDTDADDTDTDDADAADADAADDADDAGGNDASGNADS